MKKTAFLGLLFFVITSFSPTYSQQGRLVVSPMQIVDIASFGHDTIVAVGGYLLNPVSGWPNPSGFITRSTDGGATWQVFYRENSDAQLHKLFALNDSIGFAVADSGLMYKTIDAGYTWKKVALPAGIHLYDIEFTDSLTGYATGSQEKYLKTTDGGLSWTVRSVGVSYNGLYDIDWVNDTTGYLCGEKNYRTYNGGTTWSTSSYPFFGWQLKQHWKNALEGWCCTQGAGLAKSINGGSSWSIDSNINFVDFHKFSNSHFIGVKDTMVYESTDSGTTWNIISALPLNFDATSVHFTDALTGYAGGTNKIYKTIDGGYTWNPSGYDHDFGMNSVIAFDSVIIYALNTSAFLAPFHYTLNGGLTWNLRNIAGVTNITDIDFANPTIGFLASASGLYKTLDSGATFSLINPIVLNGIKAFDQNHLFGYNNSDYFTYSNDGGLTWNTNASNSSYPKLVKVNSSTGFASVFNSLYRTIDGGITWNNVNVTGILPRNWDMLDSLNGVAKNHNTDDVYITTDGGNTWIYKSTYLNIYELIMTDPSSIMMISSYGSYLSADSGSTFSPADFYFNPAMDHITKSLTGDAIFFGKFMALNPASGFPLCKATANFTLPCNDMFEADFVNIQNQSSNATQYTWSINGANVSSTPGYTFNGSNTGAYDICLKAATSAVCYDNKCDSMAVVPYASQWLLRNTSSTSIYQHRASFVIGNYAYECTGEFMGSGTNHGARLNLDDFTSQSMATLPAVGRHSAIGFAINGKGYIGLGIDNNNNYMKDLWQYDPITDAWLQKTSFPGLSAMGCTAIILNNKAYIINGCAFNGTAVTYYNECWEYDPVTDSWLQRSSFPGAGRTYTMAAAAGNVAICGGGNASLFFNDYYQYNPVTDQWTAIAPMPSNATRTNGQTFSRDNKAYFIGGYYLSNSQTTVWSYDGAVATWDSLQAIIPDVFIDALCYTKGDSVLSCFPYYSGTFHSRIYYLKFAPLPTGIEELQGSNEDKLITIYPNPSDGKFSVQCNLHDNIRKISLYNSEDKLLYQRDYAGKRTIEFNVQHEGFYFLKVETAHHVTWKKVVVIR